jgi:hypothetical protein
MPKPTRLILEKRLNQVVRYLNEGKNALTISEIMHIPYSTVQRYVKTVTERQRHKWNEISNESLENRALLIKRHYEDIAKKAEERLDDPDISVKELEIASKLLIACHRNIYEMLKFGPLKFNLIPIKEIDND